MTMFWKGMIGAVAICAGTAIVDATQQSGATTRREPQFENNEVRVWKSIIQPNQPLSLHRHDHGRTIVALKGGTLDVVDPSGKVVAGPMHRERGILYAEIDASRAALARRSFDVSGHYNRPDVFHFEVDRTSRRPVTFR